MLVTDVIRAHIRPEGALNTFVNNFSQRAAHISADPNADSWRAPLMLAVITDSVDGVHKASQHPAFNVDLLISCPNKKDEQEAYYDIV